MIDIDLMLWIIFLVSFTVWALIFLSGNSDKLALFFSMLGTWLTTLILLLLARDSGISYPRWQIVTANLAGTTTAFNLFINGTILVIFWSFGYLIYRIIRLIRIMRAKKEQQP
jgi:uncharacterized membrane protein